MELSVEKLTLQLPHYLTAPRREGIRRALAEFPDIKFFYLNAYQNEVLQGDVWSQLTALNFPNGARKKIRGVVLSNSCEVDPGNTSILFPQLIFVPLLRVDSLSQFLQRQGYQEQKVESTIAAIRKQEVDSFFYFPPGPGIGQESVAWLDQVHTMPLSAFLSEPDRKKLATLTDPSFYMFAFKLSIYFCRLHENGDRSEAVHQK
jgi:hypothetical protein